MSPKNYPPITVMKYRGSEDGRAKAAIDLFAEARVSVKRKEADSPAGSKIGKDIGAHIEAQERSRSDNPRATGSDQDSGNNTTSRLVQAVKC